MRKIKIANVEDKDYFSISDYIGIHPNEYCGYLVEVRNIYATVITKLKKRKLISDEELTILNNKLEKTHSKYFTEEILSRQRREF